MAKIASFKVDVPCDDDARADTVKGLLLAAVRGIGPQVAVPPAEGDAQPIAEATAFFPAASVKTFVVRDARKDGVTPARGKGAAA